MAKGINVIDLPEHIRKSITKGQQSKAIPKRLIILGKVLQAFKGMNRRDARWILRQALKITGVSTSG